MHSFIACLALLTMSGAFGVVNSKLILVGSSEIHFSEISKTKLRDLYTGQTQMVGDTAVLVIDRDDNFGERSRFITGTLGFSIEEFQTVQRLLECIGISESPTVARNSHHVIELLSNNPNALGYLTQNELKTNGANTKLKPIKVLAE